jgi:hypothetical protein
MDNRSVRFGTRKNTETLVDVSDGSSLPTDTGIPTSRGETFQDWWCLISIVGKPCVDGVKCQAAAEGFIFVSNTERGAAGVS